jgi:hypothetical protein
VANPRTRADFERFSKKCRKRLTEWWREVNSNCRVRFLKLSDDSIKLCNIKICEAVPPRPAFVARWSGVSINGRKTKSENPALEPEAEAKILARRTRKLLRL